MQAVGFIGFGEAARAITDGWVEAGIAGFRAAFDIKTLNGNEADAIARACAARNVLCRSSFTELGHTSDVLFSLVTADNALAAAEAAAPVLKPGTLYLDCNSCSPRTKCRAAGIVGNAGGRYVDVAIMSPIYPKRHRTPCIVSGPYSADAAEAMAGLGMTVKVAGPKIGEASSIKMVRSVMIKGTEALMAECFLAAEKAGVSTQVLASLTASDPAIDWPAKAGYCLERMMVHGNRRSAEMREVVATLDDLGLKPRMSAAAADWQAEIGNLGIKSVEESFAGRVAQILETADRKGEVD